MLSSAARVLWLIWACAAAEGAQCGGSETCLGSDSMGDEAALLQQHRKLAKGDQVRELSAEQSLQGVPGRRPEFAREAASNGTDLCMDAHPNVGSPDMVHVAYACDPVQMEGLLASVASVINASQTPKLLTVHIMVQPVWVSEFKERFGIKPECQSTVATTGAVVRVHTFDSTVIEKSKAKILDARLKSFGSKLDSLENFARFYMHLILEKTVVIWLDADTIVQSDLAQLRKELIESQKTIGFVARWRGTAISMKSVLRNPAGCNITIPNYQETFPRIDYNAGVYAVDLQRWADKGITDRVEAAVQQHNDCGGHLWVGGSQPPLLIAFFGHPLDEKDDFIVFNESWNVCDLGYRKHMAPRIRTGNVLHWSGPHKPWDDGGLYSDVWMPHRDHFDTLFHTSDIATAPVAVVDASADPDVTQSS